MNYPRPFSATFRSSRLRSVALRTRAARLRVSKPVLAALPILGAVPILAAPALAAPAKLVGVQAWTNGSQTYIRVRPDTSTPIVAKVTKHTPLYVWGKYNGWYRVQTHDDIFGWVHYELINSPGLNKVKELNADAVEIAAERSADITMWGTPQQLKDYYAKHGAKGAAKGLIEMGVPVTIGGNKSKAAPQKVVSRPAAKPKVVTSSLAQRVPVKSAPVVQQVAPNVTAPTTLPAQSPVRTLPPAPPRTVVKSTAKPASKPTTKRLSAKEKKRQQLRAKMGMADKTAPVPINQIAPVSPEDLMKARREYLKNRQEKLKDAPPANPNGDGEELGGPEVQPASFDNSAFNGEDWAPFSTSGWSGSTSTRAGFQTADRNADAAPGFRLIVEEDEAKTLGDQGVDEEELRRWNSLPALESLDATIIANAQKKAPSRGGSPRDRYKANAKSGDFRQKMANQALSYRGRPYIFGAASPSRGFDCSGLIYFLLRQRGYNPPRMASGYRSYGTAVSRKDLKPGDLLLFANTYKRGISHIGIYIGNNNFVHAASTRQGVRTDSLSTKYYAKKYHSARRVPKK